MKPIEDQIQELSDEVLECRDTRHWWRRKPFYRVKVEGGVRGAVYLEREVVCTRCRKAHRFELFEVHRNRIRRLEVRSKYDKGYLLHGVPSGVNTTEMCRLEQLARAGVI